MKTRLFLELENVMNKFLNRNCEYGDYPNGFTYEELHKDMAKAAELVFDANFTGQAFAEESSID